MARTLYEERSYSDNWHGKAKRIRYERIEAVYSLLTFLGVMNLESEVIYEHDFWEVEEYVNRVMWSGLDKK